MPAKTSWQAICHIYLIIYKFSIYKFCCLITDIVNPSSPLHLIFSFKCFGYTLLFCHFFYLPNKHSFCLIVNVGKIAIYLCLIHSSVFIES